MNVMRRFTLRSLARNKKRTIVTIIGVIISTAMLAAVSTLVVSFMTFYQQSMVYDAGPWHVSATEVSYAQALDFAGADGIADAGLTSDLGYALHDGSENPSKPYLFVQRYDTEAMKLLPVHLTEGRLPESEDELVLAKHAVSNGGVSYKIGDTITLDLGRREYAGEMLGQKKGYYGVDDENPEAEQLVDTVAHTFTIVGMMERPGIEPYIAPGYTAISFLDTAVLAENDLVDVYAALDSVTENGVKQASALADSLGISKEHVSANTDLLRAYGVLGNDQIRRIITTFAAMIIAIIMAASVMLIYNAFSMSVAERLRQLGMLASVGATRRQKRANVYFEGFVIGAIGIPLGIVFGVLGIGVTLQFVSPLIRGMLVVDGVQMKLTISPLYLAVAAGLAALTIFISAYVPARRASLTMPIDAIRQAGEVRIKAKTVRTSGLIRKVFGMEGALALKNLKRSRRRYRVTIVSLTVSLVLFLTVSTAVEYTNIGTDMLFDTERIGYDILLSDSSDENEKVQAAFDEIRALDSAEDSAQFMSAYGSAVLLAQFAPPLAETIGLLDENGAFPVNYQILALEDADFARYAKEIGADTSAFASESGKHPVILLNRVIGLQKTPVGIKRIQSEALKVSVGDQITFTPFYDDAQEDFLTIGAITETVPLGGSVSGLGTVILITTEDVYEQILSRPDKDNSAFAPQLALKAKRNDELSDGITTISAKYGTKAMSVINLAEQAKQQYQVMLLMGVFLYGFIILISLICVVNILNTISTNVMLRRKEFAMLRSVGMTPKGFDRMMRLECIFYGMKALLYGLPLSGILSFLLFLSMQDAMEFGFFLPWKPYALSVVLVFAIIFVTMLYSVQKIRRENIVDALKDENS